MTVEEHIEYIRVKEQNTILHERILVYILEIQKVNKGVRRLRFKVDKLNTELEKAYRMLAYVKENYENIRSGT